jgi:hypothetical protein
MIRIVSVARIQTSSHHKNCPEYESYETKWSLKFIKAKAIPVTGCGDI